MLLVLRPGICTCFLCVGLFECLGIQKPQTRETDRSHWPSFPGNKTKRNSISSTNPKDFNGPQGHRGFLAKDWQPHTKSASRIPIVPLFHYLQTRQAEICIVKGICPCSTLFIGIASVPFPFPLSRPRSTRLSRHTSDSHRFFHQYSRTLGLASPDQPLSVLR